MAVEAVAAEATLPSLEAAKKELDARIKAIDWKVAALAGIGGAA